MHRFLLMRLETVGWVTGLELITATVVKQLPNMMKAGINMVIYGVRRKRITGSWEQVFYGIASEPIKNRISPRFHGPFRCQANMSLPRENGIGNILIMILTKLMMRKKFVITCCVQYLAHFPMLRKIRNMLRIN